MIFKSKVFSHAQPTIFIEKINENNFEIRNIENECAHHITLYIRFMNPIRDNTQNYSIIYGKFIIRNARIFYESVRCKKQIVSQTLTPWCIYVFHNVLWLW